MAIKEVKSGVGRSAIFLFAALPIAFLPLAICNGQSEVTGMETVVGQAIDASGEPLGQEQVPEPPSPSPPAINSSGESLEQGQAPDPPAKLVTNPSEAPLDQGQVPVEDQEKIPACKLLRSRERVLSQYVVNLTKAAAGPLVDASNTTKIAADLATKYGGTILHIYIHSPSLMGFSVRMDEAAALAMRSDPRVAYVEEDGQFSIAIPCQPLRVVNP